MARLTGWLAFVLASQTGIATGEVGESTTNLGRRLSENHSRHYHRVRATYVRPFRFLDRDRDAFAPCIASDIRQHGLG